MKQPQSLLFPYTLPTTPFHPRLNLSAVGLVRQIVDQCNHGDFRVSTKPPRWYPGPRSAESRAFEIYAAETVEIFAHICGRHYRTIWGYLEGL